ncbi:hypothetical protein NPIL_427561 [Nephila pilipes]|uniref:Uncharacterized protein n=1 Tax=Nephila pilipes TaxID=299642 RepID=A0A8X6NNZ7_NEPPI|nr:hypothetical protein NPIL_427561 [Nephila pilipes]
MSMGSRIHISSTEKVKNNAGCKVIQFFQKKVFIPNILKEPGIPSLLDSGQVASSNPDFTKDPKCGITGVAERQRKLHPNPHNTWCGGKDNYDED